MIPREIAVDISSIKKSVGESWSDGWPQTRQEFEAFVERFMPRLVGYACRRLGRMEEAEDVIQDVFVKAYADREKLRKVRRVGPYIYRMVANACIERRRGRKLLSLDEIESCEIPDGQQDEISTAMELRRIDDYLRRLPGKQAEVVRLRILDGFSLSEIAEFTGSSLPAVKSRLRYGLLKLRRIVPMEESE